MVDNKDDQYEGEEGEYHFSDDQLNYDIDTETPKTSPISQPEKESLLAKFSKITPRRRAMIAGAVFIVLISLVYKMLSPSSPEIPTEFSLPAQTAQVSSPPKAAPAPAPVIVAEKPSAPAPVEPPAEVTPIATVTAPMPPNISEKLFSLEQQNTAIMNLLQTEYAQKISDYEMQNNLNRGKIDEMTKRVNRMEASLNQITQLLQENVAKPRGMAAGARHSERREPKMIYSVQAIIPGRAWLKSESGDTVTVAEGDILRSYGRISKIDPYDGIVEIDTGSKVITLSYGISIQ